MKYKRPIAALLALLLICALSGPVCAHDAIDETKKGSITVEMNFDGKAVTGGKLAAYRVAKVVEDNGNYGFEALAPFKADDLSQETLNSAELAAALAKQTSGEGIAPTTAEKGVAKFQNLELGLYLIVQTKAAGGYEPLKPFLVSVPMLEEDQYVYDVNAKGKFQLHQEPKPTTPKPTKPSDPTLPQTGQLNWPIPVLAVSGLLLFSLGWALRFWKKKDSYEK